MTNKLIPQDRKLLNIVGEVLHYIWDPIGVSGVPQARDEYDGYVGPVFTLVHSGAVVSDISVHLQRIASERMGLPGRQERSDAAATVLIDWRNFLADAGA